MAATFQKYLGVVSCVRGDRIEVHDIVWSHAFGFLETFVYCIAKSGRSSVRLSRRLAAVAGYDCSVADKLQWRNFVHKMGYGSSVELPLTVRERCHFSCGLFLAHETHVVDTLDEKTLEEFFLPPAGGIRVLVIFLSTCNHSWWIPILCTSTWYSTSITIWHPKTIKLVTLLHYRRLSCNRLRIYNLSLALRQWRRWFWCLVSQPILSHWNLGVAWRHILY